jgi:hypothetical protein
MLVFIGILVVSWLFNIGLVVFHLEIEFETGSLLNIWVGILVAFQWMVFHSDGFSLGLLGVFQ